MRRKVISCPYSVCSWREKLPLSKSALERTWLYHEIGRCHLELGDNAKAKDFGEKSLVAAKDAEDDVWQLNAGVLVAQAEGKVRKERCINANVNIREWHMVA